MLADNDGRTWLYVVTIHELLCKPNNLGLIPALDFDASLHVTPPLY